jgi:hypothetical protein
VLELTCTDQRGDALLQPDDRGETQFLWIEKRTTM